MPSVRFITALAAQETDECPIHLVTISRADYPDDVRLATGGQDVVSNGDTFLGRAMKVTLPGESAELGARRGAVSIDNIEQDVIARLRTAGPKPDVRIDIVLASHPDDIELRWVGLKLDTQTAGAGAIDCELAPRDDAGETWPYQNLGPSRNPGLFS